MPYIYTLSVSHTHAHTQFAYHCVYSLFSHFSHVVSITALILLCMESWWKVGRSADLLRSCAGDGRVQRNSVFMLSVHLYIHPWAFRSFCWVNFLILHNLLLGSCDQLIRFCWLCFRVNYSMSLFLAQPLLKNSNTRYDINCLIGYNIDSPNSLLGIPVWLLFNANISSANHIAATLWI